MAALLASILVDRVALAEAEDVLDLPGPPVSSTGTGPRYWVTARMGWTMPWYTMTDGFDVDFGVDEWHGTNAFIRDGDRVFRTYFVNSRGDEALGSVWSYLDMTALGRQEEWEDSPEGCPQTPAYVWWNWHDEYGDAERSQGWLAKVAETP